MPELGGKFFENGAEDLHSSSDTQGHEDVFRIDSFGPYMCCFLFKHDHIHGKAALGVWRSYGKTVGWVLSAAKELLDNPQKFLGSFINIY